MVDYTMVPGILCGAGRHAGARARSDRRSLGGRGQHVGGRRRLGIGGGALGGALPQGGALQRVQAVGGRHQRRRVLPRAPPRAAAGVQRLLPRPRGLKPLTWPHHGEWLP